MRSLEPEDIGIESGKASNPARPDRLPTLFPVQFQALAQFIATTAEETSTETAKMYIGHLCSHHIDQGYNTNIFDDERIKRILRGASRIYGTKPKRERMEIT